MCVCGVEAIKTMDFIPLNQIKETLTNLVIPYFVKVCVSPLTPHRMSDSSGFVIIVSRVASVLMECDSMPLAK